MSPRATVVSALERSLLNEGRLQIAGCDEAGRGALAGPVFAAAVVLDYARLPALLADSKTLSAMQREHAAASIRELSRAFAVSSIDERGIERCNILQSSLLAMRDALIKLERGGLFLDAVLVDGPYAPELSLSKGRITVQAIVDGDAKIACISAAGILAKTARDAFMRGLDAAYPQYGFARHFGYPTPQHLAALRQHGPCGIHRRSFAPVRALLAGELFDSEE